MLRGLVSPLALMSSEELDDRRISSRGYREADTIDRG